MNVPDPHMSRAFEAIWRSAGLPDSLVSRLSLTGNPDTAINSSFRLGVAAQVRTFSDLRILSKVSK